MLVLIMRSLILSFLVAINVFICAMAFADDGDRDVEHIANRVWDSATNRIAVSTSSAVTEWGDGRKTVSTPGTAEAISGTATGFLTLTLCAETDNTGVIAAGASPIANLSTREGVPLDAGECYTLWDPSTLDLVLIDTTVTGDGATFHYSASS